MNVTEIRKLIRESEDKTWYKSVTVELNYPYANFEIELTGLDTIYQFFSKQLEFFEKIDDLPKILETSKKHFKECLSELESYAKGNYYGKERDWRNLKSYLQNTNNSRDEYYFNKKSEVTDFIIKLDSEFKGAAQGAYDFLTNGDFKYNHSDKNYFIGWHRAYEFFTQDADLVKRRNSERQTLSRIRSEYIKNLEQNDKNVSDHIAEKEKEYLEKEKEISKLIQEKNTQYESWKSDSQSEFKAFLKESNKTIEDLEKLYKEKLKLEAPAQYWKDRSAKLKKEGDKWLYGLITVTVIAIATLVCVLYFISDGTLKELFDKTGSAIRWSVVFITFVSFLAYAIRTFAKLMFSAYHLHRDAEEREQLSYVYLALKKEQNIDETERHLIMQSLFSRADSGLLRDDSSPTMPGGSIVEKIFGGK